jgi:hypothetical protein
MKGVLQTMFLKKLRLVLGMVMVVAVLGATGLAHRAGGQVTVADRPRAGKPADDVEALRKEVELLRLNLLVVLEKVRSQEVELRALRGSGKRGGGMTGGLMGGGSGMPMTGFGGGPTMSAGSGSPMVGFSGRGIATGGQFGATLSGSGGGQPVDALKQAEDALKALREARDPEAQRHAADALEQALQRMRSKKPTTGGGLK